MRSSQWIRTIHCLSFLRQDESIPRNSCPSSRSVTLVAQDTCRISFVPYRLSEPANTATMNPGPPTDTDARSDGSDESRQSNHTIVGAGPDQILDVIQRNEATMQVYHTAVLSGVVPDSVGVPGTSLDHYRGITLIMHRRNVRQLGRMWTARDVGLFRSEAEQQELQQRIASREALFEDAYTAGEAHVNEVIEALTRFSEACERAELLANAPERYVRCVDHVGAGPRDEECVLCGEDFAAADVTVMHVARIAGVRCNRVTHKACLDQWWAQRTGRFAWKDTTCPFCRGVIYAKDPDAEVGIDVDEIVE